MPSGSLPQAGTQLPAGLAFDAATIRALVTPSPKPFSPWKFSWAVGGDPNAAFDGRNGSTSWTYDAAQNVEQIGSKSHACPDKAALGFDGLSDVANGLSVGNAVRHGSIGIRVFGSQSSAAYVGENLVISYAWYELTRRWPCGYRAGGNAAHGVIELENAANTEFPK